MLSSISSDSDFRNHLHFDFFSLDSSQKSRFSQRIFQSALHKLKKLSVDLVADLLSSLYSSTGRPAIDPSIFIRSFILMQHLGFTSIDRWCDSAAHDSLFLFLVGASSLPSASSHYDFINRLTGDHPHRCDLLPAKLNFSKAGKLKRGEKWINFAHEDTSSLADAYSINPQWDQQRYSYTLQLFFDAIAVVPSSDLGLFDPKDLVFSGDGSSLHIHSSLYGHKVSDPSSHVLSHRYSAPEADLGWDSDLGVHYFGFSLYSISYHNPRLNIDLPCFLSIEKASRHDALTTISATAQFSALNPVLHPRFMCFDSASDNYPTYDFLHSLNIIPIIDINCRRRDKNPFGSFHDLNQDGVPICLNHIPMIYNGYEPKKHRNKYRCPLALGKISSCPHKQECCPVSTYGKIRYIKDSDDIKLFGPVPFKSDRWKKLYKNRTCTERMNNRILNDYHLHSMHIRNRAKFLFFTIFAGINIHLDAQTKVSA